MIAASTRVLLERRRRALEEAPARAVLGREFVTFRGLAERCAAETDVPVRALLDAASATELVALCARGKGDLGARLRERPGLATALTATLRDLRDAGVSPSDLPATHGELAATYRELERAFERLAAQGVFDRVGLFRLALGGAGKYLARRGFTRVEVHGATELVGSVGDLLDAVRAELPADGAFRFFQPDYQSDYAARLRAEWSWPFAPEAFEVVGDPALDPDGALPPEALKVRRARSPREELEWVAREVLELLGENVPPSEIQIVARTLEPYAPWLAEILGGYGIPFTSSLARREIGSPSQRAWLDLARVLTRDLERAPLVRLAGAADLRVSEAEKPAVAALAEKIAREAAVVRGQSDWRAALAAAASSAARPPLARVLDRLVAGAAEMERVRDFASAARVVSAVGRDLLGDESGALARGPLEALARLDLVRAAAGVSDAVTRSEVERAFETALLERSATPFDEDAGGARVLDAVQARGLPCRHLFLIGMVHGAWPRPVSEDPFLSDSAREELRSRLKRPVPVSGRASDEDRFLLGLLLSQARERVVLSFPESDSAGRAQTPSALLHSLPFVAPYTDVLAAEPEAWDARPRRFVRAAEALTASTEEDAEAIAARLASDSAAVFRAGRELIVRTDSIEGGDLRYDCAIGPEALALPETLSPSTVEEVGRCPVRALFSRFLRAGALESLSADELEASEVGLLVHAALETIYRALHDRGLLRAGTPVARALQGARAELPRALEGAAASRRLRVRERHPTVWIAFLATVARALDDFLERDLEALLESGVERLLTEHEIDAVVSVGSERLALSGKIDRIAALANGQLRVSDYKTSRQFDLPLKERRIREGLALQIPLYARMVASRETAAAIVGETLTVPLRPERDREDAREEERSLELAELETLSTPALAEVGSLLRRGVFPTTGHEEECRFCKHTVACRFHHPPSRARIEQSEQGRGYFALAGKSRE